MNDRPWTEKEREHLRSWTMTVCRAMNKPQRPKPDTPPKIVMPEKFPELEKLDSTMMVAALMTAAAAVFAAGMFAMWMVMR